MTFVGDGKNFRGTDTISFAPAEGGGTRVTYVADLGLKGVAGLALPFIRGRLDTMSDDAVAGLKAALDSFCVADAGEPAWVSPPWASSPSCPRGCRGPSAGP